LGRDARAFIFVYGILMRGLSLHRYLSGAPFIGTGRMRGTLVSFGDYPGLIDGDGEVRGEIYRIDDPALLEVLDDVEDHEPTDPDNSLYLRVERDARLDEGSTVRAWVYLYNRDTSDAKIIASGDWRCAK
jgi:gamma-glutamylcyclotransferase (GGCT)/AIG2-like uncharacterized protein YtfP